MAKSWYNRVNIRRSDEVNEDDPHLQADLALTKTIADKLQRHYPGHPWLVEVTHAQGIATITIPLFTGRSGTTKYVLHISKLKTDPGLRSVVRAGGEILERLAIPRNQFSAAHFMDALNSNPIRRVTSGILTV